MNTIDYIDLTLEQWAELERNAYAVGNVELANLLQCIIDLKDEIESMEAEIEDLETLESWERENGPADAYKEFFFDCFERLNYPAPSVTSDYDKSVIFDAIEKGEQ